MNYQAEVKLLGTSHLLPAGGGGGYIQGGGRKFFWWCTGGVENKITYGQGGVIYFVRYWGGQMCSIGLAFHLKS